MKEILDWPIKSIRDAVKRKDLRVSEIAEIFAHRISEADSTVKAFLTFDLDHLMEQAKRVEERLDSGAQKLGFLTGIPIAVKDNIVTRGVRTTCGSKILESYVPPYSATVIEKLQREGALLLGKTNCDEFAMGSSTENSAFFDTRNPWNLECVPGGSSGGSAAAVAARMAPGALGSDTGGSIRQPASYCGVYGLKPTYGRVSRYGLVAFGSSLDQIGPFGRSTRDLASILQVIAGKDRRDSTSAKRPVSNFVAEVGKDVHELRIGIPQEWFGEGLSPEVREPVEKAIQTLERLGCAVEQVHLPHSRLAIATYYIIAPAEASSNLARFDGVKYGFRAEGVQELEEMYVATRSQGFGEEVKRRIMIGTYVLSSGYYDAYYLKAGKVRTQIKQDYLDAFEKVDVIVGPTAPAPPFRLGEKSDDPLEMYLTDIYTVTANLAGIPALSLPCGFTPEGLPVGLHLLGPHFSEGRLLRLSHALETELALDFPDLEV